MTKEARHHHYISQCYLRGFSTKVKKNWKIVVGNIHEGRYYETNARNVAGIRDFNRFEAEGIDPNYVENGLSKFETQVAESLKNISMTRKFEGEDRNNILNLIALFAVRSPQMRENMRDFHERVAEKIMDVVLSSKERYEHQFKKTNEWMKEKGEEPLEPLPYEKMKGARIGENYTIEVPRENHIVTEIKMHDAVLQVLGRRNWKLRYIDNEDTGCFITSDMPVALTWNDPENLPVMMRQSPGFGMTHTEVLFPISRRLCVVGEFDGAEETVEATDEFVAAANFRMIEHCYNQFFTPKLVIPYLGPDNKRYKDRRVMERWKRFTGSIPEGTVEPPKGKLPA